MVATTDGALGRFDMGRVVQRTFGVLGRNFAVFAGLALVLAGLPQVLMYSGVGAMVGSATAESVEGMLGAMGTTFGGFVAVVVGAFVLQAAVTHGTVADLNGKRTSFGDALRTGFRVFLPLLGLGVLMAVAILVGYVLLIVPGIILSILWSVAAPALVVERRGVFASFGRSMQLTEGARWMIFGLGLAYVIASWLFSTVVGGLFGGVLGVLVSLGGITEAAALGPLIGQALAGVFTTLVGAAGAAATYYELRAAKEGVGAEALAAVFD